MLQSIESFICPSAPSGRHVFVLMLQQEHMLLTTESFFNATTGTRSFCSGATTDM